jgi:hypothetical protein
VNFEQIHTTNLDILDMLIGSTPLVKNKIYSTKKGRQDPRSKK